MYPQRRLGPQGIPLLRRHIGSAVGRDHRRLPARQVHRRRERVRGLPGRPVAAKPQEQRGTAELPGLQLQRVRAAGLRGLHEVPEKYAHLGRQSGQSVRHGPLLRRHRRLHLQPGLLRDGVADRKAVPRMPRERQLRGRPDRALPQRGVLALARSRRDLGQGVPLPVQLDLQGRQETGHVPASVDGRARGVRRLRRQRDPHAAQALVRARLGPRDASLRGRDGRVLVLGHAGHRVQVVGRDERFPDGRRLCRNIDPLLLHQRHHPAAVSGSRCGPHELPGYGHHHAVLVRLVGEALERLLHLPHRALRRGRLRTHVLPRVGLQRGVPDDARAAARHGGDPPVYLGHSAAVARRGLRRRALVLHRRAGLAPVLLLLRLRMPRDPRRQERAARLRRGVGRQLRNGVDHCHANHRHALPRPHRNRDVLRLAPPRARRV
mmetsp:Transcript_17987/g.56168  ORF Transcript_17987/g.56168 Transcript_17987/m.56168 type:complete len:435 (-) Transcript_17987:80-1384(-)